MSTDRKRLTSAIQRIAREDPEIRALLDDFRNSGGKPSESATSGSGAEDRQICCDGGTSGSTNPGSYTRDTGDGGQDGLGDDPANLDDMGGGSLTGVTDCATGTPICFEGADWIPPPGWDADALTVVDGYFWRSNRAGSIGIHATEYEAYREALPDGSTVCSFTQVNDFEYGGSYTFTGCDTPNVFSWNVRREQGETPPVGSLEWPSDDCTNLAIKGGKLVGSKFDPEAQGSSYLKGVEEIELCDDFGNSFKLRASGSSPGGWKTLDPTSGEDGYLYDANGKQIARISGSEFSDPAV